MAGSKKMTVRNDIIVIVIPLVIAIIFLAFSLTGTKVKGDTVVIELSGQTIGRYSLSEEHSIPIKDQDGNLLLKVNIRDREVYVSESTCNDHSCERMGPISKDGESIICLISRIVIKTEGSSQNHIDAIAYLPQEVKLTV